MAHIFCSVCAIQHLLILLNSSWNFAYMMTFQIQYRYQIKSYCILNSQNQVTFYVQIRPVFSGPVTYSVSDSIKEKGTIVKRKKPSINVWSVCEDLAIIHKESRSNTNKQSLYGYISFVYFDENLTKIEAIVIYVICTRDCLVGIWDFPFVIQMDILNEFNTAPIQCRCMQVDYSDITISHAIENNLHKQQCRIIGLAGTHKYNALCKIYIILLY